MESLRRALIGGGRATLDALLPPMCPITGEAVATPGSLSATGWSKLQFVDDPACHQCGIPFAYDHGNEAVCGACVASPPDFGRARAAIMYNDEAHDLLVAFKHHDRTELAPLFGAWIAHAARGLIQSDSLLAPVPLHPKRLLARRFNQAALLARSAAQRLNVEFTTQAIERSKPTPPQKLLSAEARQRNVAGAFRLRDEYRYLIQDRHIILVDDVLTTGATLSACARTLKKNGAARIDAVVVARVAKGGHGAI